MSKQRVALVTGGTRGIALALAAEGHALAVCGMRSEQDAAEAVAGLHKACGNDVLYVPCDIADAAARNNLIDRVIDHYGALHVLINNAGVAPRTPGPDRDG